jgi:hypothetical protein
MSVGIPAVLRPSFPEIGPVSRRSIAPISTPDIRGYPKAIERFYEKNWQASRKVVANLLVRQRWFAERLFRIAQNVCIDERMMILAWVLGLPVGAAETFRAGGAKSDLGSGFYARRRLDAIRKLAEIKGLKGEPHPMAEMAFFTVHYSHAHPEAGCAAWNHQTDVAIQHMVDQAGELNYSFKGAAAGLVMLVDTDLDAVTVMGPTGDRLAVRDLLDDPDMQNGSSFEAVVDRLRPLFPDTWEPLAALAPEYRAVFHAELAERIVENLAFVRNVRDSNRPPELLDHNGRIVFVGRHADWIEIEDHNTIFLIDDTEERAIVKDYFKLALKYVMKNVLTDAIRADDRDWRVPIIVNIPHDDDVDERVTVVYTRKLLEDLKAAMRSARVDIIEQLFVSGYGFKRSNVPDWLFRQVHEEFCERVVFAGSVSYRKDRLFRPFE